MVRATVLFIAAYLSLLPGSAVGQDSSAAAPGEAARPLFVDTLALDAAGRTVADLTADDLRLTVGGRPVAVESFDASCPIGAAADPEPRRQDDSAPAPLAPGTPRKIVLAVDYHTLDQQDRPLVLDAIESMVIKSKTPAEEIMLVALADEVRVEQRFTTDTDRIVHAVQRMRNDLTLWARDLESGPQGTEYFDGLSTLMDLLAAHDGAKVVVLFSTLLATRDQNDPGFLELAGRAAAARTAIYPNWARGLQFGTPRQGSRALQRLAAETGGRPPIATGDLSVQYRRAQRDLSCRYVLGFRLAQEVASTTQGVRVRVGRSGVILRYPQQLGLRTDAENRASRRRAAFVDPQPSEKPLVRAGAFPMRPVDKVWDTLLVLHFPLRSDAANAPLATLERSGRVVESFPVSISDPQDEVTLLGASSLKPGRYELKLQLAPEGNENTVDGHVEFDVPALPKKGRFVKGPLLARRAPEGFVLRGDRDEAANDTALDDEIFGTENRIEPLLVNVVRASEKLLSYWEVCVAGGKELPPEGSVVRRRLLTGDGIEAHVLSPVPFRIEKKNSPHCVHALDELAPYTLRFGQYRFEVSLEKPGGESLASRSVPLRID